MPADTPQPRLDFDASEPDRLVILPDSRQVRSTYPLYGGIQNYP
jgi:hypothetical protein